MYNNNIKCMMYEGMHDALRSLFVVYVLLSFDKLIDFISVNLVLNQTKNLTWLNISRPHTCSSSIECQAVSTRKYKKKQKTYTQTEELCITHQCGNIIITIISSSNVIIDNIFPFGQTLLILAQFKEHRISHFTSKLSMR